MTSWLPDSRLQFDPVAMGLVPFPRSFYLQQTAVIARRLIGAWIGRLHEGRWLGARVVETEAYLGIGDAAAHSWRGRRTPRVAPMYLKGGHLYVFFVYGMHHCANVVTRPPGIPEAVLLRAAEGPSGTPAGLLSGPGRLCRALGITTQRSGEDLLGSSDLRIFRAQHGRRCKIGVSRRIGVDYAGDARNWLLRFFDIKSPAVSGPSRLRNEIPNLPERQE